MDRQQLRTMVFEKTGVKLDVDDPVFALVTLNEAVLDESVRRHLALLEETSAALRAQMDTLTPKPAALATRRAIGIAAGAAVLGALLVLAGQALFLRPAAAPVAQAGGLTAAQQAALRDGEKLARIVEKLDRKTRTAIEAEMQKP